MDFRAQMPPERTPQDYAVKQSAEWRVVEGVRHGLTNPAIAARCSLSIDAVKFHVSCALNKLELTSRQELQLCSGEGSRKILVVEIKDPAMPCGLSPGFNDTLLFTIGQARAVLACWVRGYNTEWLRSSLDEATPAAFAVKLEKQRAALPPPVAAHARMRDDTDPIKSRWLVGLTVRHVCKTQSL